MAEYARAQDRRQNAPEWKKKLAIELLKPKRNRFQRRRVYANTVDEIWTADLADQQKYARQNKGYRYILVVLDVFSRYAWARPLKAKTGICTAEALQSILDEGRIPLKLWTDRGTEFYNHNVAQTLHGPQFYNAAVETVLHRNNIELYSTHNAPKAMIAERFIRTLRGKIESNYILTQSTVWYDILPTLVHEYNTQRHRSIKMTPEEASLPVNHNRVYHTQYRQKPVHPARHMYATGDRVRISLEKKTFEKGATPNWSEEIYTVTDIVPTNPVTYKIQDTRG